MVKKKKKSKMLNEPQGRADFGTPEAIAQAGPVKFETVDGGRAGALKRVYITQQTPMDRYKDRGLITDRQYSAGHSLFVLWDKSNMAARVTSSYDRVIVDGSGGGSGINENAFSDYIALQKSIGHEFASITRAVCIECDSASNWAKRHRLPHRMGIERLRAALDRLADVCGISG